MVDDKSLFHGGMPTPFQERVMAGVAGLAHRLSGDQLVFKYNDKGKTYYEASATLGGRAYDFEIYDLVAYAQAGDSRYESGIFDLPDKIAEADDFVRRLDRVTTSGSWFEEGDPGVLDSIGRSLKRLFRR